MNGGNSSAPYPHSSERINDGPEEINGVPLVIYQSYSSLSSPPKMKDCVDKLRTANPEFKHYLYSDTECLAFIKENFDQDVADAFTVLKPGAYKSDLWRYCILYKKGGIYLDIKYKPLHLFKFINLTEKEHFVLDADRQGIYNALIVSKPGNEILKKAIDKVVENVQKRFYGTSFLEPTGPKLLASFFTPQEKNNLDMNHQVYFGNNNNRVINFNNITIFKAYDGYLNDYQLTKKTDHYSVYWKNHSIYK
jgi:mannosyltransferase OCH1-like enzyme